MQPTFDVIDLCSPRSQHHLKPPIRLPASGVSGVSASASAAVRYRCLSHDEMHGKVSDIYALQKIANKNLQRSGNNMQETAPSLHPKNSSRLRSLGRTLGQVHQSLKEPRAADYRPHPLWLWHASCHHADYALSLFYSSSLSPLQQLLLIFISLSHL